MTPREISHWLNLSRVSRLSEMAEMLAISAMGSRGDPEEVKRQIKAWQD